MLSDDEFLRDVLPHLRAKLAAQSRESDSSHGPRGQSGSPKNDPNGHVRSGPWFPVVVRQRSKYGNVANVEVMGVAESVCGALDTPLDGWIRLDGSVMNCIKERVTLVSMEKKCLKGIKTVRGESVAHEKYVVRVSLKGLDESPLRQYFIDFPENSSDHQTQTLISGWESRMKAREDYPKVLKAEYDAMPRVSVAEAKKLFAQMPYSDENEKIRRETEVADRLFGKGRGLR